MKHKILFLLTALLCSVTIAYGQTITSLANADPQKSYVITSANATLSQGGKMRVDGGAVSATTTGTTTNDTHRFAFVKDPFNSTAAYYLYNVGAGKFVTKNGNNLALSDTPGEQVYIRTSGSYINVNIGSSGNTYLRITRNAVSTRNNISNANDRHTITQDGDFNSFSLWAKFLKSNKYYTITANASQLSFYADGNGIRGASRGNSTAEAYRFAFIQRSGNFYLYSVGQSKFVTLDDNNNCRLTDKPDMAANTTLDTGTGDNDYPFVVCMGDRVYCQAGGGNIFNWYPWTNDGNNMVQIREVADFNPSVAEALLPTPIANLSATSNYKSYTIRQEGNPYGMYAFDDKTTISSTNDWNQKFPRKSSDPHQQFAFIQYNGNYYLYSVSRKMFISTGSESILGTGTFSCIGVTEGVLNQYLTLRSTGNSNFPAQIQVGGQNVQLNDWHGNIYSYQENHQIFEAEDFDPTEALGLLSGQYKLVNYRVVYAGDGSTVYTESKVVAKKGAAQLPPGFTDNGLMTYTYSPATIGDASTEVTVTATWNGPFELSANYASARWYFLKLKGNHFVTYTAGNTPNVASPTTNAATEGTQWAFIGNPYTGLTLVNQAAGSSNKLVSDDPSGDGNSGGSTYATLQTSGSKDKWIPSKSTYLDGGFFLRNVDGYYLNHRSDANLAYWTGGHDLGSTFQVETVASLVDELEPWFTKHIGEYFALPQTVVDALLPTYQNYHANGCTLAQFRNLKTQISDGTKKPATGYYRIKTTGSRDGGTPTYLTCPDGQKLSTVTTTGTAATVVKLTGTFPNYTLQIQDRYCKWFERNWSVPALVSTDASEAGSLTFSIHSPGIASILNQTSTFFFHEDAAHNVVAWTDAADAEASKWMVEDATSTNLTLNTANDLSGHNRAYATAYLPFDVTLPDGVKAFALTSPHPRSAGDETLIINPTDIGREVPAGTPVLIASDTAGTLAAIIGTVTATAPEANILQGIYFPETSTGTSHLVLNKNAAGNIGFYNLKSGNTLQANRAYIPYSQGISNTNGTSSARDICIFWNFDIDDEATISDVTQLVKLLLRQKDGGDANLAPSTEGLKFTDVNGDGKVTIADVTALVNKILGK